MVSRRGTATVVGLVVVVAVVAFLYTNGRLDPLLYRFGLNHNPCTHSVSGSVVCGPNITGTDFSTNQAGGGGGSSGNPANAAGGVGQSVNNSVGKSGGSVP
jgi:hypothetical protein